MTEKLIDTIRDLACQNTLDSWKALMLYKRAVEAGDEAARLYLEELVVDLRGMRFSVVDVSTTASGELMTTDDKTDTILHNVGPGDIYLTVVIDASTTTGVKLAAGDVLHFGVDAPNFQINGIADNSTTKLAILQG